MSPMIMLGKPFELNDAWSKYKYIYLGKYRASFIEDHKDELDKMDLEFALGMFRQLLGEQDYGIVQRHVKGVQEVPHQGKHLVEIELDERLTDDEFLAFPRQLIAFIKFHIIEQYEHGMNFKTMTNMKTGDLLGYRVYLKDGFQHAMTIADSNIVIDNIDCPYGREFYMTFLKQIAGLE